MPSLRIGERGLAEPARHHRQRQRALVEILRCRQHARGDIATRDDRVLHTLHHHVDAFGPQATAGGRIVDRIGTASAQPKRWLPSPSSTMRSMRTHGCSCAGRRSLSFCASRPGGRRGVVPAARAARVRAPAAAAVPARRDHRPAGRSPCGNGEHQRPTTMEPRPRVLLPCFHATFHSKSSCQPRCCRNVNRGCATMDSHGIARQAQCRSTDHWRGSF